MFSKEDLKQISDRGSDLDYINEQISFFIDGFPDIDIVAPATVGSGIIDLSDEHISHYQRIYVNFEGDIVKFVPASGAATRMFKDLYQALESIKVNGESYSDSIIDTLFNNLEKFPFYKELTSMSNINRASKESIIKGILFSDGLNYSELPKALIKFHKYINFERTSFEEQLVESTKYCKSQKGSTNVYFTVSDNHLDKFKELEKRVLCGLQEEYLTSFNINYSVQDKVTDTIAVNLDNTPFRDNNGSLQFRPAGHGALLKNLNRINSDVIVIKNIDNVCRENLSQDTILWKQVLIGILLEARDMVYDYINKLDSNNTDIIDSLVMDEIEAFLESRFSIVIPPLPKEIRAAYLKEKLNRPIRVCGMVKNTGEPGGGPYICKDFDGSTSLQILESAQLDSSNSKINELVSNATHFNPVDIVCSIKDRDGKTFDLSKFVDKQAGFISIKSINGKSIKALELPGLWNGSMSQWNTIFVQVPLSTFNPVKTIFDLLKPEHNS